VALALAAGTSGAQGADGAAPAVRADPAVRDSFVEGRYEGPEGARRYRLWVPADGDEAAGGRALVLMLHGCTQDAADAAAGTRMHHEAGGQGWLTLYPEQPADAHPQRCWRWYLPEHQRAGSGEPALLLGMLDRVVEAHDVDPGRVYLAGISAGGAMAAVLAATRPDRFRAVAIHSGMPYAAARGPADALTAMRQRAAGPGPGELARRLTEALDGRPAPPLLVIHGEEDRAVAPGNARELAAAWLGATGRGPAAGDASGAAGKEGAEPGGAAGDGAAGDAGMLPPADVREAHDEDGPRPWRLRAWSGDGPRVELRTVEGLGHAWSGGDAAGSFTDPEGPPATDWIIDFFREAGG
jgi:poly(hydroxyalkanoate) depolymerase family esterase